MTRQVSDEVCDRLREEIRQFLAARPDVTMPDLVHYTKLSEHTGRAFMNGNCPGGREVVGELRRALAQARAGDILPPGGTKALVVAEQYQSRVERMPKRRQFYETSMVQRVGEVLDYCAENAAIGVCTAGFGAGKTEAVRAWRQGRGRRVESLVFEFDEFSASSKVDCVQQLARAFGVPVTPGSQFAGRLFREVCDHLRENPCLLIFDQAETVRARVFQVIRQCWDRTHDAGVGVVILAAPILLSRLNRSGMEDLGALTSRVGIWAPLTGVTRAEMAAIVKREGIADVDEDAFHAWWTRTGGSMRRLMATIDLLKARHAGRRVTEKTIQGVAGHLWGMSIRHQEAAA